MTIQRILLVDDDPDIRRIAALALRYVGGFEVIDVSSGPEALEAAASRAPDVILLDVMMPGMDGPRTLAALRESQDTASIPVIFMTAKVQRNEVDRYRALGALGTIAKPFDPMTLHQELHDLIGEAR